MFCWPDFGQSAAIECRPLLAPSAIFDGVGDGVLRCRGRPRRRLRHSPGREVKGRTTVKDTESIADWGRNERTAAGGRLGVWSEKDGVALDPFAFPSICPLIRVAETYFSSCHSHGDSKDGPRSLWGGPDRSVFVILCRRSASDVCGPVDHRRRRTTAPMSRKLSEASSNPSTDLREMWLEGSF